MKITPRPDKQNPDVRSAAAALFFLLLILYGSLFPFRFHAAYLPRGVLEAFRATARGWTDRGDVISNVLLYFPLGFFTVRAFPRFPAMARVFLVAIAGAALSTSIELLQFFDDGRGPSVFDAAANTAGMLIGAVAGAAVPGISIAAVLLSFWFGSRLLPYVPALDPRKYARAVEHLLPFDWLDAFHYFALWLVAAALLQAFVGNRSNRALAWSMILVFAARVVIVDTALSASELAAAGLAAVLWIAFLSRLEHRALVVCSVLVAYLAMDATRPFQFNRLPRRFGWIPFRSFMSGPREGGSRVFLEKAFMYGSLLWLLRRAGFSTVAGACAAFFLVLFLRLLQVYLPGRSAEITDAIMVLIFGGFMLIFPE